MSTPGIEPTNLTTSRGEWQFPLVYFSVVLALWVATWFGVSLLV